MNENPGGGDDVREQMARVLRTEAGALSAMAETLGPEHLRAVEILASARGRVIVSGIGKSGHIARKIAATLASTGTPAQFVHPTEASHGDLGMITREDVCLIVSNSGETRELADLVTYSRRFAIPLITITGRRGSTLDAQSDVTLFLPDAPEACLIGVAPTTSTTASLALGDALVVALMHRRGFRREDFQLFHPGGKLGAQLTKVEAMMHRGDELPLLAPRTPMREGLITMTSKGFGVAGIVEADGRLSGIITDGDLRRNIDQLMGRMAGEVATRNPKTIPPDTLGSEALKLMNEAKISALFVVDEDARVLGLLHIHDCLRSGVA
ncbi:KpsF/GutQ family sugar-phosphate isomerase [Psychromarinibacter sp. C21-152]|uniref:KpsF/GutQ family sugar-phosphate isomerase n=1 Tax=Psychromarinibacter sediminicola TaxID=3033385 RepID=A0AAE3NWB1_9RHOB|nr:KpsF/GutQ family sugar-phosphate isomerase [Psychromarinibacter sediminicola]MDF0602864.1 KpsF/GutQ family sugar-phosphate isomerase [Psychromarinibacter sediminicola]